HASFFRRLPFKENGAGRAHYQFEEDDMDGRKNGGIGPTQDQWKRSDQDNGNMYGNDIANGFLEVAEYAPAFAHGSDHFTQIVVGNHQVRSPTCYFGTLFPHRDADSCRLQRGAIVYSITGHGYNLAI